MKYAIEGSVGILLLICLLALFSALREQFFPSEEIAHPDSETKGE
jgi:hypothetical protein